MKKLMLILLVLIFIFSFSFGEKKEFSYFGLKLGISMDETISIIESNNLLKIDESRFFGKINEPVPFIVKATYQPFIPQIYVQFYSNISYGITIHFNPAYFDYFTLCKTIEEKYGKADRRTSKFALWSGLSNYKNILGVESKVILKVEFPSTVKVYDEIVLLHLNSEISQNIVRVTNMSVINSNRRALLNEF